jgi:hypothetical protein
MGTSPELYVVGADGHWQHADLTNETGRGIPD